MALGGGNVVLGGKNNQRKVETEVTCAITQPHKHQTIRRQCNKAVIMPVEHRDEVLSACMT
jgi:hypothetical protein